MDPYRGQHEVWARTLWAAVDVAEKNGLSMEGFFDGLPFDATSVKRMRRVDWVDYCIVCERVEERAGGPEECRRMLSETYHQVVPELRALAGSLVSPKAFLRFVFEIMDPILFPPLVPSFADLGERRVRVGFELRRGARPCEAFFYGSIGAVEGLPRHLELPPAEILSLDVGANRGIYELELPESRTFAARLGRASRAVLERAAAAFVLGYSDDGTPLRATFGRATTGDDIDSRIHAAIGMWELTERQVAVLRLLATGKSNKEIARTLACAENTVELHVTQLLRKARARSRAQLIARFWSTL